MEQETLTLILSKLNEMNTKMDALDTKIDFVHKTLNDKIDNVFNVLNKY